MAKVIKAFRNIQDSYKPYAVGDEYTGPREQELIEKGYLEALKDNLADLTVKELKEQAKARDIEGYSDMKKAELIEALKE